jgi:DNA-binding IclR family transcriptional regulator
LKPAAEPNSDSSVERALNILEAAARRRDGLTNSEISLKLGIPKSSASYILRTLERRGYLRRAPSTGRYRLGLKILSLGADVRTNLELSELALPFMRSLLDRIHLTIHLAVFDQDEAVYIEKIDAPGFFRAFTWVGRRMELHSTSVGKCLLAWRPRAEVEALLKRAPLHKRTPRTITSVTRLLTELDRVHEQGYAIDDEENTLGARCFGAPIFDAEENVVAAVSVTGTLEQTGETAVPKVIESIKETARRISRQLSRGVAA